MTVRDSAAVAVPRDAVACQGPQRVQEPLAQNDQLREDLLQDIAVVLAQQPQVLADFVADQLDRAAGKIELQIPSLDRPAQPDYCQIVRSFLSWASARRRRACRAPIQASVAPAGPGLSGLADEFLDERRLRVSGPTARHSTKIAAAEQVHLGQITRDLNHILGELHERDMNKADETAACSRRERFPAAQFKVSNPVMPSGMRCFRSPPVTFHR